MHVHEATCWKGDAEETCCHPQKGHRPAPHSETIVTVLAAQLTLAGFNAQVIR